MIYNSELQHDVANAKTRFNWLIENKKSFELTEKRPKRSISQNSYLHLILSWYAWEYGETVEYIKQEVFKKEINKDIFETEFINKKTGEIRTDWKSTSNLDRKQMTVAIDRFRNYASKEAGIYLPEPNDMAMLQDIENKIRNNQYL